MTHVRSFWRAALACGLAAGLYAADSGVSSGLNRFAVSAYSQLAEGGRENLVFSPFSISSALSMALTGARGQTAAEISKVLGQDAADRKYHEELAALVEQIAKSANIGGNQLLHANALWVQKGFQILPDFQNILKDVYKAPLSQVDFESNLERARAEVNGWTERQTHGKIQNLFPPGSIDARTRLVLSSATYFFGKWEHPFRLTDTKPAPFHLSSGGTHQTEFMNQTGKFGYAETPAGQFLEMKYAGTGLAFDVLLPKAGTSAANPELSDPEKLTGWLGSLHTRTVAVALPKFRVESELPLSATLARMGMPSAFNSSADFSGIDDHRRLALSQVRHKAYVDVNEEGTEAAAATGAAVALVAYQQPTAFRADRPFVFLIRDTRTGLILFAGRVMDPKR